MPDVVRFSVVAIANEPGDAGVVPARAPAVAGEDVGSWVQRVLSEQLGAHTEVSLIREYRRWRGVDVDPMEGVGVARTDPFVVRILYSDITGYTEGDLLRIAHCIALQALADNLPVQATLFRGRTGPVLFAETEAFDAFDEFADWTIRVASKDSAYVMWRETHLVTSSVRDQPRRMPEDGVLEAYARGMMSPRFDSDVAPSAATWASRVLLDAVHDQFRKALDRYVLPDGWALDPFPDRSRIFASEDCPTVFDGAAKFLDDPTSTTETRIVVQHAGLRALLDRGFVPQE